MKQDKQSFCVIISKREKDGAQPLISYMVYFLYDVFKVDISFS